MSQSANPYAVRLGINSDWKVKYFLPKSEEKRFIPINTKIMNIISKDNNNGVSSAKIDIIDNKLSIFILTSDINYFTDNNNKRLQSLQSKMRLILDKGQDFIINLSEEKNPYYSAQYIAKNIALKIEGRTPYKIAIKEVLSIIYLKRELKGISVKISGRLDGAEIARTEKFPQNERMPLSKFDSLIDYGFAEAKASYGIIGIRIIAFKGYSSKITKSFTNFKTRNKKPYFKKDFKKDFKKGFKKYGPTTKSN